KAEEVTLIGVTKTQSAATVRALLEAGITDIGENRVQEWLQKEPELAGLSYRCHLIGHLQRNKAKFLPGHIDMMQSLDNLRTMETLDRLYAQAGRCLDVLIEVNIGGEAQKNGIDKGELLAFAQRVDACENLNLRGIMTIPPYGEPENMRPYFKQMYNLFVDIQAKKMDNSTVNILSMGMSSDFPVAIEEGATMVRVGTELFGPREY
ncbi:YggS family pyridoxal phosphate-dependent enzyme, partial [Ruminococcaceae bacterium OttesenSCG-928-I18]|nr:YggS family pyridoxal phosphate-dependent enzyme [Ruminococcaceae bacterium OttesenSCG-928-I18]